MSKAIVVIDMPNRCKGCDFLLTANDRDFCRISLKEIDDCDFYVKRADWCPLVEVPTKIADSLKEYAERYNACIDEILKGVEENE